MLRHRHLWLPATCLLALSGAAAAADRGADAFIGKYDKDGDHRLSFSEFPCFAGQDGQCDTISQGMTWELYDRDRDGFVTASEVAAVARSQAAAPPAASGKE